MPERLLTWRQRNTPRNLPPTTYTVSLWFRTDGQGNVTSLVGAVESQGARVQRSAWPVGETGSLALVTGRGCVLREPPTGTTAAEIITDSVGPIPADADPSQYRPAGPSRWRSDEGLIRVEVEQPGKVSTRKVTHRLLRGGHVVAVISDVRYVEEDFPADQLAEMRRLCAGKLPESGVPYGALTSLPNHGQPDHGQPDHSRPDQSAGEPGTG